MYKYSSIFNSDTRDQIRSSIDLVDDSFRSSLEVRESFFRILKGKTGVARVLHEMHELGFLSAYIPEFESLNCFVQYDHYHRYTADEHTLLTLNVLDELAKMLIEKETVDSEELQSLLIKLEVKVADYI